ncbi:protein Smf [Peptoclostridium acidaminophilum DSM 3953]|uniref:Protein Smf n=1 Tax=Peptoclostridium acidaminophilum DSM 3953 TaxID=1286171 RepID=W8U8N4_PEPAC|nr:DNA-processing protein DprA [Peptoclostridium acidaminophilum]AHM57216.1 protein Smf [Peptoclostridium acidaminophilum DSM 3953]
MAKGIDGYAHTACIKSGGYTLAFMGGGADVCYPSEHRTLYERITESGAVVSEYPPGTRPFHRNFARRNYLIGAWSKEVLVVQAGEKSGALITACFAMKSGKSVLSAPDRIYEGCSAGSNMLIQKGARIYLGREQLLEGIENICKGDMGEELTADTDSCRVGAGNNDFVNDGLSNLESRILSLIEEEPRTLHEIWRLCPGGCRIDSVEEALFSLEMDMKIEQRGGFFHSKRT